MKQLNLDNQYADNYLVDAVEKNSAYDHQYNLGLATTQGTTNPSYNNVPRLSKVESRSNVDSVERPTGKRTYFATYGPRRQGELSQLVRQGSIDELAKRQTDMFKEKHSQTLDRKGDRSSALRRAGYDQVFDRDKADLSANAYSSSLPASSELFNPILGFSEGAAKKQMAQRELKQLFTRSRKSSYSRSRSKSKVAQLILKRKEAEQQ